MDREVRDKSGSIDANAVQRVIKHRTNVKYLEANNKGEASEWANAFGKQFIKTLKDSQELVSSS